MHGEVELALAAEHRVRAARARRRTGRPTGRRSRPRRRDPSPGCAGRRRRPTGIFTFTSRGRTSTPVPRQCEHGVVMIVPRPPHVGHTCENENGPWSTAIWPEPPQSGHGLGRRARLRAAAVAHRARRLRGERHRRRHAVDRVQEVEVQLGLEVRAALRRAARRCGRDHGRGRSRRDRRRPRRCRTARRGGPRSRRPRRT